MIETVSDGDHPILWFLDHLVIFEYYQISNGQFSMSCLYSILKRFPRDFLHKISWILHKIYMVFTWIFGSIFCDSGSWHKTTWDFIDYSRFDLYLSSDSNLISEIFRARHDQECSVEAFRIIWHYLDRILWLTSILIMLYFQPSKMIITIFR